MRYTLIAGLVCLPTVALLASAALTLLVSKLRQAVNRRFRDPGTTQAEMDRPMAVSRNREGYAMTPPSARCQQHGYTSPA